jgi:GT2 family glycosyltransferase
LVTDNPNPGIFENVEHLIAAATGDAFTILGDDDLLDPDFCRRLAEPMQADPSVVLTFCDHRTIDGKGDLMKRVTREISRAYGRDTLPDGPVAEPEIVALRGGIWLGFALYRRSVFGTERFDRSCETAADWDFAIRASQRGRLSYVSAMLGAYRDHRESASRRGLRNESSLAIRVLSRHVMRDSRAEQVRQEMLRAAAKRNAYQMAALDRAAARRSLRLYSELGGGPWSLQIALARVMLVLPRRVAGWTRTAVSSIAGAVRRLKRVALPL